MAIFRTDGRPSRAAAHATATLLFAAVLLGAVPAAAQQVTSLGDLFTGGTGSPSSFPEHFVPVGAWTVFAAEDQHHGRELWRTDGTGLGTEMVRDLFPGTRNSGPDELTPFGGLVYFVASSPSHGRELWRTDGTAAGTILVADVSPGVWSSTPKALTVVGDQLFFSAVTVDAGRELWRLPLGGTPEMVADLRPGSDGSNVTSLLALDTLVAFAAYTPDTGWELGLSDGTEAGTTVYDIVAGSGSNPKPLAAYEDQILFFGATTADFGEELWRIIPATGQTRRLTDAVAGSGSSRPSHPAMMDGTIFFAAETDTGPAIWRSGGETSDTVLIDSLDAEGLIRFGTEILFVADGDLWTTDGTASGTQMLASPGIQEIGFSNDDWLVPWNGWVYFHNADGIWRSDGTAENTSKRFTCSDVFCSARWMSPGPDGLYLSFWGDAAGHEPWRTTTGSSFSRLADIRRAIGDSLPRELTSFEGRLYFVASTDDEGRELLVWDGVAPEAMVVEDLQPGTSGSNPSVLTTAGSGLYYRAHESGVGIELRVVTDPSLGSSLVADLEPGSGSSRATPFAALGSDLLFSLEDDDDVNQLWKTSGSGVTQISSFPPIAAHDGVDTREPPAVVDGMLYFVADDGSSGEELWRTDGTTVEQALDLWLGSGSSFPAKLTGHQGQLYFEGRDSSVHGLWTTDGTVQNTQFLEPGFVGGSFSFGSDLFFLGYDEAAGFELWKSDGTPEGTARVTDVAPGPEHGLISSHELYRAVSGSQIFFLGHHPATGFEPWVSDGTAAGTRLVKDIVPGAESSSPWWFTPLPNGEVVFSALTGNAGWELWRSDGTAAGTSRVSDVAPGPESADPWWVTLYDDWVVFEAYSGIPARELWAYRWNFDPEIFSDDFESGGTGSWSSAVQ